MGATALVGAHAPRATRNNNCNGIPLAKGPLPGFDTVWQFLHSEDMSSLATQAKTPEGYTRTFSNLHSSVHTSNTTDYLGSLMLDSYDPDVCARSCNNKLFPGALYCYSFNIFLERSPTVKPGEGCLNPPATTLIKCTFWGRVATAQTVNNAGYREKDFTIAIAGSNGYDNYERVQQEHPGYEYGHVLGQGKRT